MLSFKNVLSSGEYSKNLLKEADNFKSQGKYDDALKNLFECVEINPDWVGLHRRIAWICVIHDNFEGAFYHINKAINILSSTKNVSADSFDPSYDVLGEIYLRKNDLKNAITAFDNCLKARGSTVIDVKPDDSTIYRLGICYLLTQDYSTAYDCLAKAVALTPKNPKIYFAIANACFALARYTKSIDYYSKAVELSPEWDFNFPIAGQPDNNEARQYFLYSCLVSKSVAYDKIDDIDNCLKCNEEAYAIHQNEPTALINLAALYAKKGNVEKVRKFLEEGIYLIDKENNKNLIQTLLLDVDFSEYRKQILNLLQKQNKILQDEYERHIRLLENKKTSDVKTEESQEKSSITQNFFNAQNVITQKELNTMNETRNITTQVYREQKIEHNDGVVAEIVNAPINFGSPQIEAFVNELQQLKTELENAKNNKTFDEEDAAKIERHLNEAITQSSKPNPDKVKIAEHIEHATDIAKSVSKFVETAKPIVSLLITAGKAVMGIPSL